MLPGPATAGQTTALGCTYSVQLIREDTTNLRGNEKFLMEHDKALEARVKKGMEDEVTALSNLKTGES